MAPHEARAFATNIYNYLCSLAEPARDEVSIAAGLTGRKSESSPRDQMLPKFDRAQSRRNTVKSMDDDSQSFSASSEYNRDVPVVTLFKRVLRGLKRYSPIWFPDPRLFSS